MQTGLTLAVIGGGAAGLMAAITAARCNPDANIIILDGAKKLGAKILVSGGARCNVTHAHVSPNDYAGGSRNSIKKILLSYDVPEVITFFEQLGLRLKKEPGGKLFPVSDSAKDVVKVLLTESERLGIEIRCQSRITQIQRHESGFKLLGDWGSVTADKVILATGGKSLPKSGSDGFGYQLAKSLGHGTTPSITPALVPLCLPKDHRLCLLSGVTLPVDLKLIAGSGKVLHKFSDSLLLTHFGISGPAVLDISRYWISAKQQDSQVRLMINWLPDYQADQFEQILLHKGGRKLVRNVLKAYMPASLADTLCVLSDIKSDLCCDQLSKPQRKTLLSNTMQMPLSITGDKGFTQAEVTAGGIPLSEINANTMESRLCTGLYLCGEICDVDGRIGGFNFQWAWASGYVAGLSAATK